MKYSILSSLLLFSISPSLMAGPGQPFQDLSDQIDEVKADIADLATDVGALATDVAALATGQAAISSDLSIIKDDLSELKANANTLEVEVVVHTDVCASGSVQCNADAANQHTFEAASSANHNPFPIRIVVSKNGQPVSGLTASDFTYNNHFVPAGGTTAVACDTDCGANWFQSNDGVYSFFIDRFTGNDLNNWKAGNYAGKLEVSDSDGAQGVALVAFSLE